MRIAYIQTISKNKKRKSDASFRSWIQNCKEKGAPPPPPPPPQKKKSAKTMS